MISIDIFWQDLTAEKQEEILEKIGENCNWDVIPIATIEIEEDADGEMDIDENGQTICNCGYSCDLCTDWCRCTNSHRSLF